MKKILCVALAVMLALGVLGCGAPAATESPQVSEPAPALQTPEVSGSQDELETALRAAATIDEVGDIMKPYVVSGDYEAQMRCADRMLEIDPEDENAWYAQAEARILLLKSEYEELNDIIAQGFARAGNKAGYVEWLKNLYGEADLKIDFPFASDYTAAGEMNAVGSTPENLMSVILGPEWAVYRGLFASQGDWIYFADPDDGFALYKKQVSSGEKRTRLCGDVANDINIVGDWIYFANISDNNALYKIRTDGDMKTKLSDDPCGAVAAKGEWICYSNQNEDGRIYKIRADGSERQPLGGSASTLFIVGDWLYFSTKDERNLYRLSLEDGQTQQLLDNEWHVNLVASGEWLYFVSDNNGLCIKKIKTDGSGEEVVWKYNGKIVVFAVCGGRLVVAVRDLSGDEYVLVLDAETMNQLVQSGTFATGAVCTDTAGNVYISDAFGSGSWHQFDLEKGTADKI